MFWFILSEILCDSWIWLYISFTRLGKFLAIITSVGFSVPFSLSSPFWTPIMWMLICDWCCSSGPLNHPHFLKFFFFLLLFHLCDFYYLVFQIIESILLHHLIWCWFPLCIFISIFQLSLVFFILSVSLLKLCEYPFSPEFGEHLCDHNF